MRFATIEVDGVTDVGLVRRDGSVVTLSDACAAARIDRDGLGDLLAVIERWDALAPEVQSAVDAAEGNEVVPLEPSRIRWLPPLTRPSKVLGVAANNQALFESAAFIEDHPVFFTEPPSALTGHLEPIVVYPHYGLTHSEAELAVVVGRRSKHLTVENALDSVFGYTIVNDVTSGTLKSGDTIVFDKPSPVTTDRADEEGHVVPGFEHGRQTLTYHARSKGTDTFLPCGPWITTKDEVPTPDALTIRLWLGDELVTEDTTASLRFSVADVLVQISAYITLEPGDIVHVGTAVTHGKYKLRDLDFQTWDGPATIEIDGLGRLSNPVVRKD